MGTISKAFEKNKQAKAADNESVASRPLTVEKEIVLSDPIPHSGSAAASLYCLNEPSSVEAEIFRQLKTKLLFPLDGKRPRQIMVTSAIPGEGKSFVAANLAVSIAQNLSDHVILIDCDLRKPSIHRLFGYDTTNGINEYLSGSVSFSDILLSTPVDRLRIVPAGHPTRTATELMSSSRLPELLARLRDHDSNPLILIDAAPPHFAAEANAIVPHVDGVLLVIKYGVTRPMAVNDLLETIGKDRVMGVVLNCYHRPAFDLNGYHRLGQYSYYQKAKG